MNEIVIQIPIYKTDVLIYWGDRKGLYKAVKRNSDKATAREVIEEVAPNTEGLTVTTSGRTVIIYLASPPRDPRSGAILIHELSHATNFILQEVGIPHTEDTEEAYTYLLEYLTRETLKRIAKILQNAPKEPPTYWELSDREREIVRKLSSNEEHQAEGKSSETPKES